MNDELLYQVALTRVPQVGDVVARALLQCFGSAREVFEAPKRRMEKIEGIGEARIRSIKNFNGFKECEKEVRFIEKYHITPLFINQPDYPRRLLHCYDSPVLLYYKGTADLNAAKIISIVGTRNHTEYGKWFCNELIAGLKGQEIIVVSGLAYGIDTLAHKASIKNQLSTVGVLAHGLDTIYPSPNKILARQMTEQGGLLTEFGSGTKPDRENFPRRNRIVAGMCDAIVVVQSGLAGGSLITAELANGYNKEVFALPGRANDPKSEGCHYLIKSNKAILITCVEDLLSGMNWLEQGTRPTYQQAALFPGFGENELQVLKILEGGIPVLIDQIYANCNLNSSAIAAALLQLEMAGVARALPGKQYQLV